MILLFGLFLVLAFLHLTRQTLDPTKHRIIRDENGTRVVTAREYLKRVKESHCMKPGFMDMTFLDDPFDTDSEDEPSDRAFAFPTEPSHTQDLSPIVSAVGDKSRVVKFCKRFCVTRHTYAKRTPQLVNKIVDSVLKLAESTPDTIAFTVEQFEHKFTEPKQPKKLPAPSIIMKVPGTGPVADETLIHCAHFDSINESKKGGRAPGGEDNLASCAIVIEHFLAFIAYAGKFAPDSRRTLEFHLYSGEEQGLKGGLDIAKKYKADGRKVVAVYNNDCIGFMKQPKDPDGKWPAFYVRGKKDLVNQSLVDFGQACARAYTALKPVNGTCGYACSDHAAWPNISMIASSYTPNDGTLNPAMHTDKDTLDNVNFDYVMEHLKAAVATLGELAKPATSPDENGSQ